MEEKNELILKLSPIRLYNCDVEQVRKTVVDGQTVEVHCMMHYYARRLEVVTKEGEHIGFFSEKSFRGKKRFQKMELGMAFDAQIQRKSPKTAITVCFDEDVEFFPTTFPERTHQLDWNRADYDQSTLPLEDALYITEIKATPYQIAYEHDIHLQKYELEEAFPDKGYMFKEIPIFSEKTQFFKEYLGLTLLEQIPLGAELEVRLDVVNREVNNNSLYSDATDVRETCAYPAISFVFFYQNVRVAYYPVFPTWEDGTNYPAYHLLWKWSKNPTMKARSWLINTISADSQDGIQCKFAFAFFEGDTQPNWVLDMYEIENFEGKDDRFPDWKVPISKIFSILGKADEINLCNVYHNDACTNIYIKQGEKALQMPLAMYQTEKISRAEPEDTKWYTLEELEEQEYKTGHRRINFNIFVEGTNDYYVLIKIKAKITKKRIKK